MKRIIVVGYGYKDNVIKIMYDLLYKNKKTKREVSL